MAKLAFALLVAGVLTVLYPATGHDPAKARIIAFVVLTVIALVLQLVLHRIFRRKPAESEGRAAPWANWYPGR